MRSKKHAHAVVIILAVVCIAIVSSGQKHAYAPVNELEPDWALRDLIQSTRDSIQGNNKDIKILDGKVDEIKLIVRDNQTLLRNMEKDDQENQTWLLLIASAIFATVGGIISGSLLLYFQKRGEKSS